MNKAIKTLNSIARKGGFGACKSVSFNPAQEIPFVLVGSKAGFIDKRGRYVAGRKGAYKGARYVKAINRITLSPAFFDAMTKGQIVDFIDSISSLPGADKVREYFRNIIKL